MLTPGPGRRAGCCDEFTRSRLLREAVARAGEGLPAIERGMPMPAGTGLSRRSFLVGGGAFLLSIYGATKLGPLRLDAEPAFAAGPSDPVLVSVFLEGGIDSLSVLAPVEDPTYRRLRPALALPPDSGIPFSADPRLRWNAAASGLADLFAEGKLAVFPAIGYTNPDQSHFTSRHYYEVGALSDRLRTGWMGRYIDLVGSPDNPLQGLALSSSLSPALATSRMPVAALSNPRSYGFGSRHVWGDIEDAMIDSFEAIGAAHSGSRDPGLRGAGAAIAQANRLRRQLLPFAHDDTQPPGVTSPVQYPDSRNSDFPERLALIAAMLQLGLPLRCVAVNANGGYDTHDDQNTGFADDLSLAVESLVAFQRDLEARGLADRVIVEVWSEFGRRPEQNGSDGTDHGAAGLALLIGSRVNGGMFGEYPGLDVLDADSNLRATSDFRALEAAIVGQWLNTDPAAVIPDAPKLQLPTVVR